LPQHLSVVAQATSDAHLVNLWLHGRSPHTQRAYRADSDRFLAFVGRSLATTTLGERVLADWQLDRGADIEQQVSGALAEGKQATSPRRACARELGLPVSESLNAWTSPSGS
jgi:hypothetical protein